MPKILNKVFLSKIRPKDNVRTVLSLNKVTKAGKICYSLSQLQRWCNEVSSDTNLESSMAHCSFLKLLKICSLVEELYFTDSIDGPKYFKLFNGNPVQTTPVYGEICIWIFLNHSWECMSGEVLMNL